MVVVDAASSELHLQDAARLVVPDCGQHRRLHVAKVHLPLARAEGRLIISAVHTRFACPLAGHACERELSDELGNLESRFRECRAARPVWSSITSSRGRSFEGTIHENEVPEAARDHLTQLVALFREMSADP